MDIKNRKGQGTIGILLVMLVTILMFTIFYILLDNLIQHQLLDMVSDTGTVARYNSMIKPVWTTIVVFFGISIVLWGLVGATGNGGWSIFGAWMIILVTFTVFDILYVNFDPWVMTEFPSMIDHTQTLQFYNNMIITLWGNLPNFFNFIMLIFAAFMASTIFEGWSQNVPRY